jgi:hypothetical protein
MTHGIVVLLSFAGCALVEFGAPNFDGPMGSDVLVPEDNDLFEEPVGFVANSRSGTIVPLDLKYGVLLSDQYAAAWLRPRVVATGDERILDQVVAWTPSRTEVSLFANDLAFGVLVEAPYILGKDGEPQVFDPTVTEPAFEGAGDVEMRDLELRRGYTTTEDWTVTYDGSTWWVIGSRSGKQERRPVTGEAYWTDRRELSFTLEGDPQEGDAFTVHTDTGVVEYDFGGTLLGIARWRTDTDDALLCAVWDPVLAQGAISVFDLATRGELGRIPLPKGAQPWRFAVGDDGATFFAADARESAVYRVLPDLGDPAASIVETIPMPAPVAALAHVRTDEYDHLFVAPAGTNRLELYDLATATWLDMNPFDPELGLDLRSPVVGLAATPDPITLQQHSNENGAPFEARTIAISLMDGSLVMADGDNGCLEGDLKGPFGVLDEDAPFADNGLPSNPLFLFDSATLDPVQVNTCGGVTRTELWTATYDQAAGNYLVEGVITGKQANRAYEDLRYVSDRGEIAFTILAGSLPTTDGDRWLIRSYEGVLRIQGFTNTDGNVEAFELPAAPTIFQYDAGPSGGGWDQLDRRTYALLPITNSDWAIRVRLDAWQTEVRWD